jgi:hypothetical protein
VVAAGPVGPHRGGHPAGSVAPTTSDVPGVPTHSWPGVNAARACQTSQERLAGDFGGVVRMVRRPAHNLVYRHTYGHRMMHCANQVGFVW